MKWKSYTKTNTRVPDTALWLTTRRAREVVEKERSVHRLLTEVAEMGPSMIPADECRVQFVLIQRAACEYTTGNMDAGIVPKIKLQQDTEGSGSAIEHNGTGNPYMEPPNIWQPRSCSGVQCEKQRKKTWTELEHDSLLPRISKAQPFLRPLFPFSLITFWETTLLFQILVLRVCLTRHAKCVWEDFPLYRTRVQFDF